MFQYIHVNSYSRTLSKKAKHAKWSVKDVIDEATRQPHAIPHVKEPQAPVLVYGKSIEQIFETLETWAKETKDSKNRAARKDAVCLLAGVFSAPNTISKEVWETFKKLNIEYLEKKYGDRLQTVIEHVDESHPHCHFYVIPRPGEKFEVIHEGKKAANDFVANCGEKKKTNKVYREAMRKFQDEYYAEVGARAGMTRIGPKRRRLTREEWHLEQMQANAIKEHLERSKKLQDDAERIKEDAKVQSIWTLINSSEEAKKIKEAAISEASKESSEIKEAAIADAFVLISNANSDAGNIKRNARKQVDAIEQKAEKDGFERAIRDFERNTLAGKFKMLISWITNERDLFKTKSNELGLKNESLSLENKRLVSENKSLTEQLSDAITKGKGWIEKFRKSEAAGSKIKADLDASKVAEKNAGDLNSKISKLEVNLETANNRIKHLEASEAALLELLEPKPKEPENQEKRKRVYDELSLG